MSSAAEIAVFASFLFGAVVFGAGMVFGMRIARRGGLEEVGGVLDVRLPRKIGKEPARFYPRMLPEEERRQEGGAQDVMRTRVHPPAGRDDEDQP